MTIRIIDTDIPTNQREQHDLAWKILGEMLAEYGINDLSAVRRNEHGKPYIEGGPHFSISHCKKAIAVVVSEQEVGIDIEDLERRFSPALIRYTMSKEEQQEGNPIELWTRKEAYLKAIGTGIHGDMKQVLVGCPRKIETYRNEEKKYCWSICR